MKILNLNQHFMAEYSIDYDKNSTTEENVTSDNKMYAMQAGLKDLKIIIW